MKKKTKKLGQYQQDYEREKQKIMREFKKEYLEDFRKEIQKGGFKEYND